MVDSVLERMIAAVAAKDRSALAGVFGEQSTMRALLPSRLAEASGPSAIAAEILDWFDDAPVVEALSVRIDTIGDRHRVDYRFALGGMDVPRVVEQSACCTIEGGLVERLWLICTGFRPAAPAADGQIDALGDGCATLTPRIAEAMRTLAAGQILGVLTDDPAAPDGIAAWSRLTGHEVVATAPEPGGTRFYLRHRP